MPYSRIEVSDVRLVLPPELFDAAGAMAELGRRTPMLDAAVNAPSQMLSPPFRTVLWKSVGLALVLIVIIGIAVQRLLVWLATYGTDWAEGRLRASRPHTTPPRPL